MKRLPRTAENQTMPVPASPEAAAKEKPLENLFRELRSGGGQRRSLLGANLGSAFEAVLANRVRSFLTVLGIIIGVAAVIGAITLAQGVGSYFSTAIAKLGSNTVLLSGSASLIQQRTSSAGLQPSHPSLTPGDFQALSQLPHIVAISPVLSLRAQIISGNQNWRTSVIGAGIGLQTIQNWQVAQGLWFSSIQDDSGASVAVLGATAEQSLFGTTNSNPIGQQIRIGTQTFRVIGTLAPKGGAAFGASDSSVFIPFQAFQKHLSNSTYLSQIDLEVDDQNNISLVIQEITTLLETRHHIARGTVNDFSVVTAGQLLQEANAATAAIASLLGGIAAISLTVGGISIINIMLVSVTERTREIGIRLAVGARRSDIRNQFLIEALMLCLLGGVIGIALGIFIGWLAVGVLINTLVRSGGGSSVPVVVTPITLILPFAVSAAVGLIFGLYPAIRASRLDPIAAIRRTK